MNSSRPVTFSHLDNALTSGTSVIIHGQGQITAAIEAIRRRYRRVDTIDLRAERPTNLAGVFSLRERIALRMGADVLIVMVGENPPQHVIEILRELVEGRFFAISRDASANRVRRVFAISPCEELSPTLATIFSMAIHGEQLFAPLARAAS
jgi:hypothetical protein